MCLATPSVDCRAYTSTRCTEHNAKHERYSKHSDTLMAITCLDGTALDERIIKVGMDPGFKQGRQYGRGMSGGQVGDNVFL